MKDQNLRIEAIESSLNILVSGVQDLSHYGITEDDYNFIQISVPFIAQDRSRVDDIIKKFIFASMDLQGLPRFNPPAEYIASVIMLLVSSTNYMVVSAYFNGFQSLSAINSIISADDDIETIQGSELFSLIILARRKIALDSINATFQKKRLQIYRIAIYYLQVRYFEVYHIVHLFSYQL